MTEWKIDTHKGHTHQSGYLHVHELTLTRGCISRSKTGDLSVLLDDEEIEKLIKDLQIVLRRTEQCGIGTNAQYNDISDTANRFANIV